MQFIIPKNINFGKKLLHHWKTCAVIGLRHVFVYHDMDRYTGQMSLLMWQFVVSSKTKTENNNTRMYFYDDSTNVYKTCTQKANCDLVLIQQQIKKKKKKVDR